MMETQMIMMGVHQLVQSNLVISAVYVMAGYNLGLLKIVHVLMFVEMDI